jgi:hypothetical protein
MIHQSQDSPKQYAQKVTLATQGRHAGLVFVREKASRHKMHSHNETVTAPGASGVRTAQFRFKYFLSTCLCVVKFLATARYVPLRHKFCDKISFDRFLQTVFPRSGWPWKTAL